LLVSQNVTQAGIAASIAQQAASTQGNLITLQTQIQALQAQLAAGKGSTSQLATLLSQEEALRNATNSLITQLNTLLSNNRNTPGVPSTTLPPVQPPVVASASVPV
jgi:hypothetical protein